MIRYEGSSTLAHDGHGRQNLTVRAVLDVRGGDISIDFAGTDLQSAGFVNMTPSATASFAFLPFVTAFGGEVPCNAGGMRCIKVIAPERTLVNPTYPAPTGWCLQHLGNEVGEAVFNALSKAVPGRVGRVTCNAMLLFSIHRVERHGQTSEQVEIFDFSNFVQGDSDATTEHDGWGMPGISARVPLPSIELYEAERGGRIEQLEYAADSSGAGTHRGSPGTVAIISLPRPSIGGLQLTADVVTRNAVSKSSHGGRNGSDNEITVDCNGKLTDVKEMVLDWKLPAAATLTVKMGGGHGWGEPQLRSPERVCTDVADGLVTAEAARTLYMVVIDRDTLMLDEKATSRLRSQNMAAKTLAKEPTNG